MASSFRASILAQLDTKNIPNEIKTKIENQTVKFSNITFDKTQLINSIQSALNGHNFNVNFGNVSFNTQNLVQQAQQTGANIGQQITQQINSKLNRIDINNTKSQISQMERVLKSWSFDDTSIKNVTKDLLSMNIGIEKIKTNLNSDGSISINIRGIDKLQNIVNVSKQLDSQGILHNLGTTITQNFAQQEKQISKNNAEIIKYKANLESTYKKAIDQNSAKPISNQSDLQSLANEYKNVIAVIDNLQSADSQTFGVIKANVDKAIKSFETYITLLQTANTTATDWRSRDVTAIKEDQVERLRVFNAEIAKSGISINSFQTDVQGLNGLLSQISDPKSLRTYLDQFSKAKNEFRALQKEASQFTNISDVNILIGKMETWLNKNTKSANTYRNTVKKLVDEYRNLAANGKVLVTDTQRIAKAFKEVDTSAAAAGLKGRSFFEQISGAAKSLTRYFGVSSLIYNFFSSIKNGISTVVELDTALVDLKKTTDGTEAQLNSFYYSANETAKQLGVTTKEVINSTSEWSRLGYGLKDAETMAQVSAKFKAISPGVDMEQAQNGLVSAMKAFNIEADEALDGIASKINSIGNSQAVSNANIIEFLTRSSAAMKEANNTLEETIALGTAA